MRCAGGILSLICAIVVVEQAVCSALGVTTMGPEGVPLCVMQFASIEEAIVDLRAGKVIVLVDDEDRENEGDFVCAAEAITVDVLNFITRVGGGYLCVSLDGKSCDRLELTPQASNNTSMRGTAFTVSVDAHHRHGVSTGISARDRVQAIRLLASAESSASDFVRPGHTNPLRARDGGVLVRTGQTEGSVDLCRMAGMRPAACIIEIVRPDGEMARRADLERLCQEHSLKMCSVEQLIEYRLRTESLVQRMEPVSGTIVSTPSGEFNLFAWKSTIDALPHLALCVGGVGELTAEGIPVEHSEPVLVRVHRRELLGDIFGVIDGSGETGRGKISSAMRMIQQAGKGALIYLRPEWAGDNLSSRLHQVNRSTSDPDRPDLTLPGAAAGTSERDIGIGGQIIRDLGLRRLRVLSDHPRSMPWLHAFGLEIVETVCMSADATT